MNAWAFLLFLLMQVTGVNSQFTSGNLVVYQVGDGSGTLTSSATAIFLKEFSTSGAAGITLNMPTSGSTRLTSSGSATSDGQMTRSADGQYLVIAGYDAATGTASITGTSSATVNRVINIVDNTGTITRAGLTNSLYSGNNFRSAARSGNADYWGAGGVTGTHYFGTTTTAATVQSDKANTRVVNVYNGNLYFSTSSSSGSNTSLGIYQVGTGLPVTAGQTITNIINTGTGSSPYAFAINSGANIIYIADDRTTSSGGIQKWTFDGSAWSLVYTLGTGVSNIGARGITVDFSGINPVIYGTSAESSANRLFKITDAGSGSAASTLATAPANTAFRGVAFAPASVVVAPSVSLSLGSNNGDETSQSAITVTATTSANVSGDQTIDVAVSGTGITAGDYAMSNSTITIFDGTNTGSVTFTVQNDNISEGTETATLSLQNPSSGIVLGSPVSDNIVIADNDVAGVILVESSGSTAVTEGSTTDSYDIKLATEPSDDVTINIAGDAQASVSPGSLVFTTSNWNTNQTVTVSAVDDSNVEGVHIGTITHAAVSTDASYNNIIISSVLASITDNDVLHTLAFVRTDTTVNEGAGNATVWLRVTTAGNIAGTVDLAVSSYSTASNSTDYTVPVTLNVPANLVLNQLIGFTFAITDDGLTEADEYVICKLTNALNVTVSSSAQSTLYITDNDQPAITASNQLGLTLLNRFSNGISGSNSAEISAYDAGSKRLFIANSIANKLDIVDFANPAAPVLLSSVSLASAPFGGAINSVDVFNGTVAIALEGLTDKQANGKVVFTDINGAYISEATVGAMPDMVLFNKAGTKVYTANEGEPNAAYTNDPLGTISVVDISGGVASPTVATIDFSAYIGQENALLAQGIRIFGLNANAAQDFEPEYITISADDSKAWVTLQENNAIAELNLTSNTITSILPLGYKDHSQVQNAMDVSDQTFGVNISNFPVKGMYQPDAVAQFTVGGNVYLITANEGDARAYSGFNEESRVSGLNLDATAFPNAADIKSNTVLGRLNATNKLGDTDNDGDIDEIYVYGSRSFSIWDPASVTPLVFDCKDALERITLNDPAYTAFFNMSNNSFRKSRSDDKGPEPEGVATTVIGNKTYAFISLERTGGVVVYDVTQPATPQFVTYTNNRTSSTGPDSGPEGIIVIPASASPNGKTLVILSNEVSSSLTIYEINLCTAPGIAAVAADGLTSVCPGNTVKLFNTDNNAAYTRQWIKNDTAIIGATDSVYLAPVSGAYKLVVFNANGCKDTSTVINVTVGDTQNPVITAPAGVSATVNNTGCSATGVNLGTPVTSDNCSVASVTNNAPVSFPLGNTIVTWTVTDGSGNTATATQTVTATTNLQITLNIQGAIACVGGTTVMNVSATGGTAPYTGTGNFVVSAGPRTYTVTDANGCTRSASFTLLDGNITGPTSAPSRITLSQSRNLCNTTITATCTAVANAASYEWSVPPGTSIVSGQGTQTISLNISGTFSSGALTVRGVNACGNGPFSAPRNLIAKPTKTVVSGPICVSPNATGLFYSVTNVEPGVTYTWQVPVGATIVSGQGTATVEVNWRSNAGQLKCTPFNGCATGNRTVVSISTSGCSAIASTTGNNWIMYPNPTLGNTNILFTAKAEIKYSVWITDLTGKILIKKEFVATVGQNKINFNTGAFANGMYLVTIISDTEKQTFKLCKQ